MWIYFYKRTICCNQRSYHTLKTHDQKEYSRTNVAYIFGFYIANSAWFIGNKMIGNEE